MIQFPPADKGQTELFGEPHRLSLLSQAAHIVIVDDEAANVRLLQMLLAQGGFHTVTALTDARELAPLLVESPVDLVITDLHMPGFDGFAVLDILTPLINQERLPVLVVTGDGSCDARQQALTRGAKDFVTKPFDSIEVMLRVRNLLESRMLFQDLRKQNRTLLESASGQTRELESTRIEIIERLALAAEYRDDDTSQHNRRVGDLSARLAEASGWTREDAALLRRAAAMHDIGKIGIPDALLFKPASRATSSPRCCCPRACRCSWAVTSWAAPRRQQQRLRAGQRDLLVRLGGRRRRPAGVHADAHRHPARPPGLPPPPLVLRPPAPRQRRHHVVRASGTEMGDADWDRPEVGAIGLYLNGNAIHGRDRRGQPIADDDFLLLINAHHGPLDWTLPDAVCEDWRLLIDTARDDVVTDPEPVDASKPLVIAERAMVVLTCPRAG